MTAANQFLLYALLWIVRTIHLAHINRVPIKFSTWSAAYSMLTIAEKEKLCSRSSINRFKLFLDLRRGYEFNRYG